MNPRFLACLLLGWTGAVAAEEGPDMHYRPFAIEPADRIEWGEGHMTLGFERETAPQRGTRIARRVPVEWTLGLGAGFVAVLGAEAHAHTRFDSGATSGTTTREVLLKYALPEYQGFHLAAFTGISRQTDGSPHTHSRGISMNLDTAYGVFGAGLTFDRKRPNEEHGGNDAGINWYRIYDNGWGAAVELRRGRDSNDETVRHWLVGGMRVVGRGLLLDAGVGGVSGPSSGRMLTFGISYFY